MDKNIPFENQSRARVKKETTTMLKNKPVEMIDEVVVERDENSTMNYPSLGGELIP